MTSAAIQSQINTIYNEQQSAQFGNGRFAMLFKPGTYNNTVNVGFYTQVLGLGTTPDATMINGDVHVDANWMGGNATLNFWRGAENLAVTPSSGTEMWAVSQADPFRRMHVKGNLLVDDNGGWGSGGFISDSVISGQLEFESQQQWATRNSQIGSASSGSWNMVFVGVNGAPSGSSWPSPPYVVVGQTPLVREKPFLTIDTAGNYSVFVPALRSNSSGVSWSSGSAAGTSIPISQFYIAKPTTDTSATINAALNAGMNLLLTPGIYNLSSPITVTRANTVVLGLGLATLHATSGQPIVTVADVDGVTLAGVILDAGPTNSPVLLQVGPPGSSADHSANPTLLADIFARVGGADPGKATVSVQINSSNVIGDDFWIWRADHGNGVGWTANTAQNGVVVNGTDVTIYGLAVEHYQQYQTLWNGNGGHVYFYQSEAPYDPPSQSAWMDGSTDGFASYKVANTVTSHTAYGVGVYSFFTNGSLQLESAIEVPPSGVNGAMFHDMMTFSGSGTIDHVLNTFGGGGGTQYLAK
jgi:hypothetical protein